MFKQLSDNLKKMISILSDHQYHSGTDIGNSLGLSRGAIWKLIKQLTALGINIESVTNRGYKTEHILEFLNTEKIKKQLSVQRLSLVDHFFIFDSLTSTNDYLIAYAKKNKKANAVCFSEYQSAGRGRLGRSWVSPFLSNVYMSLLWNFNVDIAELPGLPILTGLAVVYALEKATNIQGIQLKWPNDIMWNNDKLGGILIDIIGECNGSCSVVIGIGLNVNMPDNLLSKIEKPWTAINRIINTPVSRNLIAGTLLDFLIAHLVQFSKSGLSKFLTEWEEKDYLE
jgi:BirA family biotin operon repressor/biotin-[acetyl-CoA-carboxylase] ligase